MVESMALPLNAYDFQVMGIHELSYSELNKADGDGALFATQAMAIQAIPQTLLQDMTT
jgi:hypothetical protein